MRRTLTASQFNRMHAADEQLARAMMPTTAARDDAHPPTHHERTIVPLTVSLAQLAQHAAGSRA